MPSGLTPLPRNSTYGLRVTKSPSSLMSFCFPYYFPVDCYFACVSFHVPVFPFLLHFLQFPVLPVLSRISLPKIQLSMPAPGPPSSLFSFTFLYSFLPCTSFPSSISLSRTSLRFRTFHCMSRIFLPKILLSMPAPSPSFRVLPFLSLYPTLPYFPVCSAFPFPKSC